jgi:predicted  nucleic acid-binding Zn-ribbon protein
MYICRNCSQTYLNEGSNEGIADCPKCTTEYRHYVDKMYTLTKLPSYKRLRHEGVIQK